MNVVVSVDSFKGSLTSLQAGDAIRKGIQTCMDANITIFPLSDGGEGFVESYMVHQKGIKRDVNVKDAMGKQTCVSYYILEATKTAVMDMASMCGIDRIRKEQQEILYATTFGLGELIIDAMNMGCFNFVIGIGGSGTNDGGSGMLMALGYKLLTASGEPIEQGAIGLSKLNHIEFDCIDKRLKDCSFTIACDVKNPLVGINGCSSVFGPQKGATVEMVNRMDTWMRHYVEVVERYENCDCMSKGCGAAGGLGFAFITFFNTNLMTGTEIVLDAQNIEEAIMDCDIVVTGEGCIDAQTVMGKATTGIAKLAKKHNKPVIAFAGKLSEDADLCNSHGIDAYFSIQSKPSTLKESMHKETAYENLKKATQQVFRAINIGYR